MLPPFFKYITAIIGYFQELDNSVNFILGSGIQGKDELKNDIISFELVGANDETRPVTSGEPDEPLDNVSVSLFLSSCTSLVPALVTRGPT